MIKKFWSGKPLGLFIAIISLFFATLNKFRDIISTQFWQYNLRNFGEKSSIQHSALIRFPQNIIISNNVKIGRYVEITSELEDSIFSIGEKSQINRNVSIDYTGNLKIGCDVVISANTKILTHSHGHDPKSKPVKKPLVIEDNVWIGEGVIILENVEIIGNNSIVAAGAVVTKSILANTVVGGNPAKYIKDKYIHESV